MRAQLAEHACPARRAVEGRAGRYNSLSTSTGASVQFDAERVRHADEHQHH